MNRLKALFARAKVLSDEMEGLEASRNRNGKFTARERTAIKAAIAELNEVNDDIDTEQKSGAVKVRTAQPQALRVPLEISGPSQNERRMHSCIGGRWGDMFGPSPPQQAFASMEDFLQAVSMNDIARLRPLIDRDGPQASANTTVPSSGGFILPDEFASTLFDTMLESALILPRARVWPMTQGTLSIPGVDGADRSDGTVYGGIVAAWLAKGGTGTETEPKFRAFVLQAKKLAAFCSSTREFNQDSGEALGANPLSVLMPRALGYFLDYAFLRGDGAGKPLGILESPALIAVAKETGQEADTIVYRNLTGMFARHASPNNAVWIVNKTAVPELLNLSIPVGTGGSAFPVMSQSGGAFNMLTRPVLFSEHLPSLGDQGDIILADLSEYHVGLRQSISVDTSNAVEWLKDLVHFRTIMRVDGAPAWAEPMQPANGDTLSPFVTLAERA